MAKGKSTWKYNKLLTPRRNYFNTGGFYGADATRLVGTPGSPIAESIAKGKLGTVNPLPIFDMSESKIPGIASVASQAATGIAGMISNIQSNDIRKKADSIIDNVNNAQMKGVSNDSIDSLMSDWSSYSPLKHVTANDLGAKSGGNIFSDALTSGISGAASGMSFGPIGAIASGIGNMATSLIGGLFRNNKAERQARRINNRIDYTNAFNERSLYNRADNINSSMMSDLGIRYAAFGGELNTQGADFTNGLLSIDSGGLHETNPLEGVPMGMDNKGIPNLVEEGETVFNDYVFSNRLVVPDAIRNKYKLGENKSMTFADASKQMAKESEERPNDPISQRGLQALMMDLAMAQEGVRAEQPDGNKFAMGGKYQDWLRYAPAIGYGITTLTDSFGLTNKPDYSNADTLIDYSKKAANYSPVSFKTIGNYLTYKPFDRNYYLNKMSSEAGATRRNIMNISGGNRGTAMSGLLAADNSFLNNIGTLARQGEEFNLAQRHQVGEFNRGTDTTNSQGMLQADMANQKTALGANELGLKGIMSGIQMKETARNTADAAKSANISGLFQTLGDIGYEEKNARMMDWAISKGVFGPIYDYGRLNYGRTNSSNKKTTTKKTDIPEIIPGNILYDGLFYAANGGKLNRTKRRKA